MSFISRHFYDRCIPLERNKTDLTFFYSVTFMNTTVLLILMEKWIEPSSENINYNIGQHFEHYCTLRTSFYLQRCRWTSRREREKWNQNSCTLSSSVHKGDLHENKAFSLVTWQLSSRWIGLVWTTIHKPGDDFLRKLGVSGAVRATACL